MRCARPGVTLARPFGVRNPSSTNPSAAASDIRNPSATNPSAAASQIPQPSAISSRRDNVTPSTGSQRIAPQTRRARAVQQGRRERVKSRDANARGEMTRPFEALEGARRDRIEFEKRAANDKVQQQRMEKEQKAKQAGGSEKRSEAAAKRAQGARSAPPLRLRRRFRRALLDRIVHRSLDAPLLDRCGTRWGEGLAMSRFAIRSGFGADVRGGILVSKRLPSEHASARTPELEELITTVRRRERVVLSDAWQRHGHRQR